MDGKYIVGESLPLCPDANTKALGLLIRALELAGVYEITPSTTLSDILATATDYIMRTDMKKAEDKPLSQGDFALPDGTTASIYCTSEARPDKGVVYQWSDRTRQAEVLHADGRRVTLPPVEPEPPLWTKWLKS